MKHKIALLLVSLMLLPAASLAQSHDATAKSVRVALVKMPYVGERNVPELSGGPDYLEQGGLRKLLEDQGFQTKLASPVALSADEEKAYGSWNRLALANGERHARRDARGHRLGTVPHAHAAQDGSGTGRSHASHRRSLCARYRPSRTGAARPFRHSATHPGGRSHALGQSP